MCASDFVSTENGFKKGVFLNHDHDDELEENLKKQKMDEVKSMKGHSLLLEQLKKERISAF